MAKNRLEIIGNASNYKRKSLILLFLELKVTKIKTTFTSGNLYFPKHTIISDATFSYFTVLCYTCPNTI